MEELLEEFYTDTHAHIEAVEEGLLKLEKEPESADIIDDIFRRIHSVKGNAGVLGLSAIHAEGMKIETQLEAVRERKKVEPGETDQLLMALDALKEIIQLSREGAGKTAANPATPPAKAPEVKPLAPQQKTVTTNPVPGVPSPPPSPVPLAAVAQPGPMDEKPRADHASNGMKTFLTFTLGKEKYAVEIMDVREIILMEPVTPVPNTKHFVDGVMNLRDQIIPVFSLRKRLGMDDAREVETERNIVIVEIAKITTGLKVDEVTGIINIHTKDITPPDQFRGGIPTDFLLGIGDTPGGSIILLNSVDICDPDGLLY
jgi:purine-binding chemotaxis protein CheW